MVSDVRTPRPSGALHRSPLQNWYCSVQPRTETLKSVEYRLTDAIGCGVVARNHGSEMTDVKMLKLRSCQSVTSASSRASSQRGSNVDSRVSLTKALVPLFHQSVTNSNRSRPMGDKIGDSNAVRVRND
jgi:hypothetical protein